MMDMARISQITNGQQIGANPMISGLVNDTRKDCAEKLYVAIAGPNFDGHEFIDAAGQNGASAALIEQDAVIDIPAVRVSDSVQAMGQIAAAWRADFDIPVLGITGSAGKTTLKEMVGAILSVSSVGVITEGNLNNHIGVPLTLTRISSADQFAVIEMGVSDDGVIILNADDQYLELWQSLANKKRVVTFGLTNHADISATFIASASGSKMTVDGKYGQFSVNLNLPGEHNVRNALAVIAAASEMGCSINDIQQGLSLYQPLANRGGSHDLSELLLIDDTYNANPVSMLAAFNVASEELHQHVGQGANNIANALYCCGQFQTQYQQGFAGNTEKHASLELMIAALLNDIDSTISQNTYPLILVKGSRTAGMERVVKAIIKAHEHNKNNKLEEQ